MSELEKVTAVTTEYDASEIQVLEGLEAVSYTHLDVYKRQV